MNQYVDRIRDIVLLNENKSQCPKGLGFFLLYLGLQVDTHL